MLNSQPEGNNEHDIFAKTKGFLTKVRVLAVEVAGTIIISRPLDQGVKELITESVKAGRFRFEPHPTAVAHSRGVIWEGFVDRPIVWQPWQPL